MTEKVSIHIPAYNAERTIEECLKSIISQSLQFDEIIVVNDNSTDNTLEVIQKYSSIKIINNKKNMGLSFNRNEAIKQSKNNIIASIDADVVLEKEWLEKLLKHLNKKNILICGGKLKEKLVENKFNIWREKYYSQNWGNEDKIDPPFLFGCNTLYTKELWEKVGGYNEMLKTNGEDIDYSNKIKNLNAGNLFYCSDAVCYHLQNDDLETLSKRIWRYHAFGYKMKEPSFLRLFKLILKQFKFMLKRILENLIKLNFQNVFISFVVFIKFIKFEYKFYRKK